MLSVGKEFPPFAVIEFRPIGEELHVCRILRNGATFRIVEFPRVRELRHLPFRRAFRPPETIVMTTRLERQNVFVEEVGVHIGPIGLEFATVADILQHNLIEEELARPLETNAPFFVDCAYLLVRDVQTFTKRVHAPATVAYGMAVGRIEATAEQTLVELVQLHCHAAARHERIDRRAFENIAAFVQMVADRRLIAARAHPDDAVAPVPVLVFHAEPVDAFGDRALAVVEFPRIRFLRPDEGRSRLASGVRDIVRRTELQRVMVRRRPEERTHLRVPHDIDALLPSAVRRIERRIVETDPFPPMFPADAHRKRRHVRKALVSACREKLRHVFRLHEPLAVETVNDGSGTVEIGKLLLFEQRAGAKTRSLRPLLVEIGRVVPVARQPRLCGKHRRNDVEIHLETSGGAHPVAPNALDALVILVANHDESVIAAEFVLTCGVKEPFVVVAAVKLRRRRGEFHVCENLLANFVGVTREAVGTVRRILHYTAAGLTRNDPVLVALARETFRRDAGIVVHIEFPSVLDGDAKPPPQLFTVADDTGAHFLDGISRSA